MSKFTHETVERVKDAADIVEIVSAYTDLRRAGERFTGLCPFHEERTPSFSVDPREKLYYCFGCEAGGDVFRFVQEKEGLGFPDAVEALGDRYGVEIERESEDPRAEEARKRRERLGELLERTAHFYANYLWSDVGEAAKARQYLATRGLGEEVLRAFGVGYAPSAWDQVLTRGQQAGFGVPELQAAGLAQKGRKGGHYDRFRARIMFPVRDPRGRVQGFGARALRPDTKPKYLNSPEGELYRKSRTLYGIDRARAAIAKTGRAVVVEGYTDVLAAHQAGIGEAVAVMGTAITPDQLQQLARYTEEVVLALDADRAGRAAMLRAQRVAGSRKLRLRVASMPAGEDPADMLTAGAGDRFRELILDAVELPEFHVRVALDEADLSSPTGRDRALDEVVPVLAAMGESISRDELARVVADRLNADPGLVMRRLAASGDGDRRGARAKPAPPPGDGQPTPRAPARPLSARELQERALLTMCVASPVEGREFLERLTPELVSGPAVARARDWLLGHLEEPLAGLPRDDDELVSLVTYVYTRADREPGGRDAMELNFLQLEKSAIEARIEAERRSGADPPVDLQRRRAELAERIAHWETATSRL
ncbi:MAG: DNA primase [Solirubrobacterales bacterium]